MPTSVSQYIYGNSLVNFTDNGELYANVPIWMDLFAEANGDSYAVSGGYGFLRNFADWETPAAQWGFPGVESAWEPDETSFADASIDSVLITPANFIQDVPPDTDYFGDTRSPLDAVLDIVDDVITAQPDARILIYEGWADMGPFAQELPISESALTAYHDYNQGAYHDWYVTLIDAVNAADPDAQLGLIPVATVLSELQTGALSALPVETFFVDTAPHGTDTTYFLAAAITYQAVYGEYPALPTSIPGDVHPDVIARFDTINSVIETELEAAGFDIAGDTPPDPVQLPDGYGDFTARYFEIADTVTDLASVDFSAVPTAQANNIDPDFLYESGSLWDGGPSDHLAVQFTRDIDTPDGGVFNLRLTADDMARVYIGGALVADTRNGAYEETQEVQVALSPGIHSFEVQYLDFEREASLQLDWDYAGPLPETITTGARPADPETEIVFADPETGSPQPAASPHEAETEEHPAPAPEPDPIFVADAEPQSETKDTAPRPPQTCDPGEVLTGEDILAILLNTGDAVPESMFDDPGYEAEDEEADPAPVLW